METDPIGDKWRINPTKGGWMSLTRSNSENGLMDVSVLMNARGLGGRSVIADADRPSVQE